MITNALTFYVNDLDEAIEWYARELETTPTDIDIDSALFEIDNCQVTLIQTPAPESAPDFNTSETIPVISEHLRHLISNIRELC